MTRLPITGPFRITATYGQQGSFWKSGHQGMDFIAEDRRIFSTCYGKVRVIGYDAAGWGQYLSVGDAEGYRHIFCHLERGSIRVKVGEEVTPATVLGTMGATGNVTGLHLHYQLQKGEQPVDPSPWLGVPGRIGSYHSKDFEEVSAMAYQDEAAIPAWAKEAVREANEKGWMLGDDQGKFNPNAPVTRAELAVVLSRLGK